MNNTVRSVMIDNWSMMELVSAWKRKDKVPLQLHEFLSAIVIWDEVLYPNNGFNEWNNEPNPFSTALTCIDASDRSFIYNARRIVDNVIYSLPEVNDNEETSHFSWIQNHIIGKKRDPIADSAISYWLLCQDQSCDYLPSPARKAFIKQFIDSSRNSLEFSRLDVIKQLDKQWVENIKEVFKGLGRNSVNIEFPLLSHFIIHNKEKGIPLIVSALHMSEEGVFVHFREYLAAIEKAICDYNINQVRYLTRNISDVTSNIFNLDKKNIASVGVELFPTPAFSVETDLKKPVKKSGLSLLYDIGKFANALESISPYSNDEYWELLCTPEVIDS